MLYLHNKAAENGFWDFPAVELNSDSANYKGPRLPRYYIEFNYTHKSKKVLCDAAFDGDVQLRDANVVFIKEIMSVLAEAEGRQKK